MKKILLLSVLFLVACSSSLNSSKLGQQMPASRLYFLDGEILSLEAFRGQDLILVFWASTCSHSYSALKDIADWKNKDRFAKKYQVISINIDKAEKEERVRELLKNLGKSGIRHSYSGNDIYDEAYVAFDVSDLPTILRVDRNGKVIAAGSTLSAVLG